MATTEIFSNRVQTTVNIKYIPKVIDTILNSNVFAQRVIRAAKSWKTDGGRKLRVPIKISKNTTFQSFRGFDTFSTAPTDNRLYMEFDPAFVQITSALPMDELAVADTDGKVLNLISLTLQSDVEDMADSIGDLMYGDGTGNNSKDPLGLAAIVNDGSTITTIGGLDRTVYTTLKSTMTSSNGTLTIAKMDTMWNNVTSGQKKPTIIITTEAIFSLYEQLLRPQERIYKDVSMIKGLKMGTGATGLSYKGIEIVADEKCPSGYMYFLNENYLDWYALPMPKDLAEPVSYKSQIEGNDYKAPLGLGFSWSNWIKPSNAAGIVGHIYFGGQLVCTNPKRQGVLTAITGI